MFARSASALVVLSVSLLAVATPWGAPAPVTTTVTVTAPAPTVTSAGQCNTGGVQCCNSVTNADSSAANAIFGLLGIVIGDVTGLVGLNCSPVTVGVAGQTCSQSPVCCTDNSHGNLVSLGCVPITL